MYLQNESREEIIQMKGRGREVQNTRGGGGREKGQQGQIETNVMSYMVENVIIKPMILHTNKN